MPIPLPPPDTLMAIVAAINKVLSGIIEVKKQSLNKEMEKERLDVQMRLNELQLQQQLTIHQENLRFKRERAEEERELQAKLAYYNRQTQLLVARTQRETALDLVEANQIFANWPLRILPSQLLALHRDTNPQPLKILLALPEIEYDRFGTLKPTGDASIVDETQITAGVRLFLAPHYSQESTLRPVQFLGGAWDSKRFRGEAATLAIHSMLKSEPTLILELIAHGNMLHLCVGYWGMGQETYFYNTIGPDIPLLTLLQKAAKRRTRAEEKSSERLAHSREDNGQLNLSEEEHTEVSTPPDALTEPTKESKLDALKIESQDVFAVNIALVKMLGFVSSWFIDAHHLVHSACPQEVPPLMPKLLPSLLEDPLTFHILEPLLPQFLESYRGLLEALRGEQPHLVPTLALQLAEPLSELSDLSWAQRLLQYAIQTKLEVSEVAVPRKGDLLPRVLSTVDIYDEEFLKALGRCYAALGDPEHSSRVKEAERALIHQLLDGEISRDSYGDTLYGL